jgi:hypothetical protein
MTRRRIGAPEAAPHIDVIAGGSDELMDAAAYQSPLPPLRVHVVILPNVDHMGVIYQSAVMRWPTSRSSARQLVSA